MVCIYMKLPSKYKDLPRFLLITLMLDAFFHTHQDALEWGVRYIDVKVRDI